MCPAMRGTAALCWLRRDPMLCKIDEPACPSRVERLRFKLNREHDCNGVTLMIAKWTLIFALTAVGCGGDAPPTDAAKGNAAAGSDEAPAPSKIAKFDPAMLKGEALKIALVPSPAEMQKALANAGLTAQLADMVKTATSR